MATNRNERVRNHGGARKGAGRPPSSPAGERKADVRLSLTPTARARLAAEAAGRLLPSISALVEEWALQLPAVGGAHAVRARVPPPDWFVLAIQSGAIPVAEGEHGQWSAAFGDTVVTDGDCEPGTLFVGTEESGYASVDEAEWSRQFRTPVRPE